MQLCSFDLWGIEMYETREINFQSLGFIIGSIVNWAQKCVSARLNEALCGKIDFELQAKI